MSRLVTILNLIFILLIGCIGTDIVDDRVDEMVVINTRISGIKVGEMIKYEAIYLNNIGLPEEVNFTWSSSDETIISIDSEGLATALSKGIATIQAEHNEFFDSIEVEAGEETIVDQDERKANLATVSSYPLTGTAILKVENGELILDLLDDFNTTSDLPGLYVYLTNNVTNTNFAVEIAKVASFSGSQNYVVPGNPGLFDYNYVLFYCKPFRVPVGNGKLE